MEVDRDTCMLNSSRVGGATAVAWGSFNGLHSATNGVAAVAANKLVCLYDLYRAEYVAASSGHNARVNAVQWFTQPVTCSTHNRMHWKDETSLASCSADGTIRVWSVHRKPGAVSVVPEAVLEGHKASVTDLACLHLPDGARFVASVSGDCTVRLWHHNSVAGTWACAASATVKPASVFEAVSITILPGFERKQTSCPLLCERGILVAAAGADQRIHLYTPSESAEGSLLCVQTCTGHTDWVRSLAFSYHTLLASYQAESSLFTGTPTGSAPYVMLCSGGQDGKVRLWRVTPLVAGEAKRDQLVPSTVEDDEQDEEHAATNLGLEAPSLSAVYSAETSSHSPAVQAGSSAGTGMTSFEAMLFNLEATLTGDASKSVAVVGGADTGGSTLSSARTFTVHGQSFEVVSDALLAAHTAWVNGVQWHPPVRVQERVWQPPCLMSCSMDKTVILWQPAGMFGAASATASLGYAPCASAADRVAADARAWGGVWSAVARIGGAGGNALGLYSCSMTADARCILVNSYQGALHLYVTGSASAQQVGGIRTLQAVEAFDLSDGSQLSDTDSNGASGYNVWQSQCALTGHFAPAVDCSWGHGGRYLVSVSTDYTTRVWAPVPVETELQSSKMAGYAWRELSRPQIHGYEGVSIACPDAPGFHHRLLAGADEKVIRVYDAPLSFLEDLQALSGTVLHQTGYDLPSSTTSSKLGTDVLFPSRPAASYVPELGLTNKAVAAVKGAAAPKDALQLDGRDAVPSGLPGQEEDGSDASIEQQQGNVGPAVSDVGELGAKRGTTGDAVQVGPPQEESLVMYTRWPEVGKLFGHLNELASLACSSDGSVCASSSKARTEDAAALWLWDPRTCRAVLDSRKGGAGSGHVVTLKGHKLTAEQLSFSHAPGSVQSLSVSTASGHDLYGTLPLGTPPGPDQHLVGEKGPYNSVEALQRCSEFLLSVGRDRQIAVHGLIPGLAAPQDLPPDYPEQARQVYAPVPLYEQLRIFPAHKRQLWAVSVAALPHEVLIAPTHAPKPHHAIVFATGARDGQVRFWSIRRLPQTLVPDIGATGLVEKVGPSKIRVQPYTAASPGDGGLEPKAEAGVSLSVDVPLPLRHYEDGTCLALCNEGSCSLPAAVTALSFTPVSACKGSTWTTWLAVGMEDGTMAVVRGKGEERAWLTGQHTSQWEWTTLDAGSHAQLPRHADSIRRLAWRPLPSSRPACILSPHKTNSLNLTLASVGADNAVRIMDIALAVA